MLEFKLNYYFEKYKDTCVLSLSIFRDKFIKENGEFPLINEVFIMVQKYQYKQYGDLIGSGRKTYREVRHGYYGMKEDQRKRRRFGTKEQRQIRKIREAHNAIK